MGQLAHPHTLYSLGKPKLNGIPHFKQTQKRSHARIEIICNQTNNPRLSCQSIESLLCIQVKLKLSPSLSVSWHLKMVSQKPIQREPAPLARMSNGHFWNLQDRLKDGHWLPSSLHQFPRSPLHLGSYLN